MIRYILAGAVIGLLAFPAVPWVCKFMVYFGG